jgi:6-phosphofructokinase 1
MNAAVRAAFRAIKMREPDREIVFFRDGFRGLAGRLDSSSDRNVDRSSIRDIIHRGGTFLGTGRVKEMILPAEDHPDYTTAVAARDKFLRLATANLFQTGVRDLIVIGGDGSFRGARVIADAFRTTFTDERFRVVGIPATIDNDIAGTDFSIGYDTAMNNVVDAIRKIRDTVESHRRAIVLEVMGNTSGWLALQCAIAGGAAAVAIPEIADSYSIPRLTAAVTAGALRDYRYFIIVVAEGVMKVAGADWMQRLKTSLELEPQLIRHLNGPMEVRLNSVGHIARGGSPTAFDNTLAGMLGAAAAEVIQLGEVEGVRVGMDDHVVVGCRGVDMVAVPLEDVVRRSPRLVTSGSSLYRLATQLTLGVEQPF